MHRERALRPKQFLRLNCSTFQRYRENCVKSLALNRFTHRTRHCRLAFILKKVVFIVSSRKLYIARRMHLDSVVSWNLKGYLCCLLTLISSINRIDKYLSRDRTLNSVTSETRGRRHQDRNLQLGLRSLKRWKHHIPDITQRLVEIETHAFAAETFGDDIELNAGSC